MVGGVRNLRLKIPGVTDGAPGGVQTCNLAIFQVNVNESDYQFYNELPVGSSTADVGQNFGGLLGCRFGPGNRDSYSVTYGSPLGTYGPPDECIVITHGQYGNPDSNPLEWTLTADAGCTAAVGKALKNKLVGQWVGVDVPFQLTACEIPCQP